MTNTQFYFALGVPFFTLLLMFIATIVSNRAAVNDLRSEMRAAIGDLRSDMHDSLGDLRSDMHGSLGDLRSDMHGSLGNLRSDMHGSLGNLRSEMRAGFADLRSDLGGRLDRIEKKQDVIDTEIRMNHDHRLAVLEARVLERAS